MVHVAARGFTLGRDCCVVPDDIRHPAQAVSVLSLQTWRDTSSVVTKPRHRDASLLCSKQCSRQSRQCNVMASYWIREACHEYSLCSERESKKNKKQKSKSKEKTKKEAGREKYRAAPYQEMWQTIECLPIIFFVYRGLRRRDNHNRKPSGMRIVGDE